MKSAAVVSEPPRIAGARPDGDGLWFQREEFVARVAEVQGEMAAHAMDVVLAFQPESVTYLTGFYTRGYRTSFQFAIIPAAGPPIVVLRDVEKYYFDQTAAFPGHILWSDGEAAEDVVVRAVREVGAERGRIGVEKSSWVLDARRFEAVSSGLTGADVVDVDQMIALFRLVKSPAEIDYMRSAARIAEAAMDAGADAARRGASERDVAIAISAAMLRNGSSGAEPGPIASGERALHIHGAYTDRVLQSGDLVHLEVTPHVRHYHARFMRPVKVGSPSLEELRLAQRLLAVQDRAMAEVVPGAPAVIADRIYREGILATGAVDRYTNKTFYSVGLLMDPVTYEFLEAVPGSTWSFKAGMAFHTYLVVNGLCFSETILVGENGPELLTTYRRELLVSE